MNYMMVNIVKIVFLDPSKYKSPSFLYGSSWEENAKYWNKHNTIRPKKSTINIGINTKLTGFCIKNFAAYDKNIPVNFTLLI